MIQHLQHHMIDRSRWDEGLMRCGDRMWYAQSWVLDRMCPGWQALVEERSGARMPLTWRRKWGFAYLYQPLGLQQLGVFAPSPDDAVSRELLRAAREHFRFIDIHLNEWAKPVEDAGLLFQERTNQVLALSGKADELRAGYAAGHRRNLKGAEGGNRFIRVDAERFAELYVRTTGQRHGPDAVDGMDAFARVLKEGEARAQCEIVALADARGDAIAAAAFATWEGRTILLKSANTGQGMAAKAMFRIVDHWIERHAGTGLLLDFAGSMNPGTARFNAGFGAVNRAYFRLRSNTLPIPFRWLKR